MSRAAKARWKRENGHTPQPIAKPQRSVEVLVQLMKLMTPETVARALAIALEE
jgi:hypothetical protein